MSNLGGVAFYGDFSLSETLLHNVMSFMQYGLLEIGAFYNVPSGEDVLARTNYPGGTPNTTFVGRKHDWIWEQDITLKSSGSQPTVPSGIYVNDVFYPTGTTITGTGYLIDFAKGQVVFDSPLPSGYTVRVPHSYRYVQVYRLEDYQYREIERDWLTTSGETLSNNARAYLPALFIGVPGYETRRGTQLGTRAKNAYAKMEFQVLAENPHERDKLKDLVYMMETKSFRLYDINQAPRPLNYRGELVNPQADWAYLSENFNFGAYTKGRFVEDYRANNIGGVVAPLYRAKATISLEVDVVPY